MSQTAESVAALQAAYDLLAGRCGGFDKETKELLKQGDEARKQFIKDRAALRQKLLNEKLAAFKLLDAAKQRVAAEAQGEAVAAEVLGLQQQPADGGAAESEKSPAMQAAAAFDALDNDQIKDLLQKHEEELVKLPGFAAPNSREEAIGLLVKAGISPAAGDVDSDHEEDGDKPLKPGAYASVSNAAIDELLAANAEKVAAVPGYVVPVDRKAKIAALVAAGVRPPAKQ